MKVLMWLGLFVLVYWALKSRALQHKTKEELKHHKHTIWRHDDSNSTLKAPPVAPSETMVMCAYCQIHVPISEAIHQTPHYFCCQEHVALYAHMPTS